LEKEDSIRNERKSARKASEIESDSPLGLQDLLGLDEEKLKSPKLSHKRKETESSQGSSSSGLEQKKMKLSPRLNSLIDSALSSPLIGMKEANREKVKNYLNLYLASWRNFILAFNSLSNNMKLFNGLIVLMNFILPLLFLNHLTAWSVMKTFVYSSVVSHLLYTYTHSLKSLFLAHVFYISLVFKLTVTVLFSSTITNSVDSLHSSLHSWISLPLFIKSPFVLHSVAYINWLQALILVDAALLVLDSLTAMQVAKKVWSRRQQGLNINKSVLA